MARFKKAGDIKVAVVGYSGASGMARLHLSQAMEAGMTPHGVAEIDPARRGAAEKDFPGIQTYASVGQMLKQSQADLVILITPHNTHAKLAIQCLRAGRHVISEKPLATTTAQCDAMIREATKRKLLLSTYHNRHWDGCIITALKHIGRGAIGQVYRIDAHFGQYGQPGDWWRSSKSISGGILYDWGVHILEYCLQIIDADIMEVSGYATTGHWAKKSKWKQDTNEDEASAVVRFKSGQWLTLTVTSLDSRPQRGVLEIVGTDGAYIMGLKDYEIIKHRGDKTVINRGKNSPDRWSEYYRNISNHLTKGQKLVITPQLSRRPIHILDLADQSAKRGRALKAKY